jgi:hypothetical protein
MAAAGSDPIAFVVGVAGGSALQLRGRKLVVSNPQGQVVAKLGFTGVAPMAVCRFLVKITDKGVMPGGGNWEHTYTYQTPNPVDVSTLGPNGTAATAIKAQIRNQILPQLRATRFVTEIAPAAVDPLGGDGTLSVKDLPW